MFTLEKLFKMGLSPFDFICLCFKVYETPIGIEKVDLECEEPRIAVSIDVET